MINTVSEHMCILFQSLHHRTYIIGSCDRFIACIIGLLMTHRSLVATRILLVAIEKTVLFMIDFFNFDEGRSWKLFKMLNRLVKIKQNTIE